MTEQDHNNLSAENLEEGKSLDGEFIPDDAWPLFP